MCVNHIHNYKCFRRKYFDCNANAIVAILDSFTWYAFFSYSDLINYDCFNIV